MMPYTQIQIPDVVVNYYGYGLPRVGNEAFADYVDASVDLFTRITNMKDPVAITPGTHIGYVHPGLSTGEAHVDEDLS